MITFRFTRVTMSADEFVGVNFRLWRSSSATRRNHWLLGAALTLLIISLGADLYTTRGHVTTWSTPVFLVVGVAYGLGRAALVRRQLSRGYRRNQVLQQPLDFTLTDQEIRGSSAAGEFRGSWDTIRRAVRVGPHWLLLYPTQAACYYLDLRRLSPPATPNEVVALVQQHGIPLQRT